MKKNVPAGTPQELIVQTHRNWDMIFLIGAICAFLVGISFILGFHSIISYALFAFAIFGLITLLLLATIGKDKKLRFFINKGSLSMRDIPHTDDKDFNKSFPVKKIKEFVHMQGIDMIAAAPRIENALCIIDTEKKAHVFLDLATPEVSMRIEDINATIHFVRKNLEK